MMRNNPKKKCSKICIPKFRRNYIALFFHKFDNKGIQGKNVVFTENLDVGKIVAFHTKFRICLPNKFFSLSQHNAHISNFACRSRDLTIIQTTFCNTSYPDSIKSSCNSSENTVLSNYDNERSSKIQLDGSGAKKFRILSTRYPRYSFNDYPSFKK